MQCSRIKVMGYVLLIKIIFGRVIIVLANKAITMHSFTLLSVSLMISIASLTIIKNHFYIV